MYGSQWLLLICFVVSIFPLYFFGWNGVYGWKGVPRSYLWGLFTIAVFYLIVWLTGAPGLLTFLPTKPALPPQALLPFHPVIMLLVPVGYILIGTGYTRWWIAGIVYVTLGVLFVGRFFADSSVSLQEQVMIALTWPYFIQSFVEQMELWGH